LRAVLLWVIDPQRMVTDRLVKYRPRIDRLEMNRFAAFLLHKGAAVDVGVPSLGGKRTLAWLNRY
jgi:hypothetical protein